jgi:bifunctional non-homologous end joining protein LigD
MATKKPDPLAAYRAKRELARTPEPAGAIEKKPSPAAGGLFVVHKHAARRLHYDLRLEMEGVLRSWAVPKGPSYDTADKRLAVHVEDHPLEYGDFEGLIPAGNYGAGAVIVWDRGQWIPTGDPLEGLDKGKLLFELRGRKLHGMWTLVKIKKSERDWLLIKERDAYATSEGPEPPQESVLSGLTVEELEQGSGPADEVRRELIRMGAPRKPPRADAVKLMLAETRDAPFSAEGWLFELKLDGYRLLAVREGPDARLISRNGNDLSASFPEVIRSLAALPFDRILIDGEVVALDEAGRPSFQRLQQRAKISRAIDIRRATVENPVTFFAFDLLGFEDFDLRSLSLKDRKPLLQRLLPPAGAIRYLEHFERDGEALYQQVRQLGLEGIVAKRSDAPYRAGRGSAWLKIRTRRTDDFVIVGLTMPKGSRGGFGALYLAQYVGGKLVFSGSAGTGFSDKQLTDLRSRLEKLRRPDPPCTGPIPAEKGVIWVEPRLVCEVEFTERTDDGLLRQPVFLRERDDKKPEECIRQEDESPRASNGDALPDPAALTPSREPVVQRFSNLDKVFWPDEHYTKGDLIEYYRSISPWILPYLRDRPVVLTRYPDGITGKSFFQKDAPPFIPDWVRTERKWSEQAQREIDYFICDDEATLLYIVNLGTIPLHMWGSRVASIDRPDWCVLDLDPKVAPFSAVLEVARATNALCKSLGLPNFIKTSGSSGLHVLVPLGRQCGYEEARTIGELLARVVTAELPEIATITRQVSRRGGKVYVDYVQNGAGRLLAAPFCVRPLPGAPVSTPLKWSEVNATLDIRSFTIGTVPERMRKLKTDPLADVLGLSPDLHKALDLLRERL